MALNPGTRLGPYEILIAIGAGGMGEVYKAKDTRLDRIVAVKVLPPEWAASSDMKARFDREAQTIASLKHPHICVLHDVGRQDDVDYLVMEYLDGETLADRLKKGPIALDEALEIATTVGDALDQAHRQGVVHRDLKPSNIMLTRTGAKILDFGLARVVVPAQVTSSTIKSGVSIPGMIIGTLQYMAPEQLDGTEADARTDIFALGVVLHEMITGRKAFEGKSQVLLMSAIATTEPPQVSALQPAAPRLLDHIVKTCLAKNPADRWQDVRDLVAELRWVAERGGDDGLGATGATRRRRWIGRAGLAAAAVLIVANATPAYWYWRGPAEAEELRFRVPRNLTAQPGEVNAPSTTGGPAFFNRAFSAVSPDGRWIAFVARPSTAEAFALYVRPVGSVTPRRLAGTDDPIWPFWSADSREIAFVTTTGKKLRRVDASGGPPRDVCDAPGFTGGTWNAQGVMLFGTATGLFRVPAEGGRPEAITAIGSSENGHYWPRFLPDGRHYLFLAASSQPSGGGIFIGALDSKDKTRVLTEQSNAAYTEPGLLLFQRDATVYAQPFNAETFALSGEQARIADEVVYDSSVGQGHFDVSGNGVLIYFASSTGSAGGGADTWPFQVAWADRNARVTGTVGPSPGVYRGLELSPDETRVAVHRHDGAGGDVLVFEPPPRGTTRITFDATQDNSSPVWSPDGKRIAFASHRNNKWGLYVTPSDGSGTDGDLLIESELPKAPMSWSPDAKRLVYWVQDPKTAGDLWILPLDGDKKPVPCVVSSKNETHAQISPNGKWIAYTSDLTGRKEVYVQPFPACTGGRWLISREGEGTLGADWPRWKHDGTELYFHSLGNAGAYGIYTDGDTISGPIYSASIKEIGGAVQSGTPQEVLRVLAIRLAHTGPAGADYHSYDLSHDGQRVLSFQRVLPAATQTTTGPEPPTEGLTVAMHWTAGIKARK